MLPPARKASGAAADLRRALRHASSPALRLRRLWARLKAAWRSR